MGWILRASCLPCTSTGLTALGGRWWCHHLAERETESWGVNHLPKVTELLSGGARFGPGSVGLGSSFPVWS